MAENIDRALGQLKDMLSTEEGQRQLEGILGSLQGQGPQQPMQNQSAPPAKSGSGFFNYDALMRMKGIMDSLQTENDPRVNLLTSLRPYISSRRGQHLDSAIKIMSLGKLPYLLKNMNK